MKVKLEFDLPKEENELKLCQRGHEYFSVLWDINEAIRQYYKYGNKTAEELIEGIKLDLQESPIWGGE